MKVAHITGLFSPPSETFIYNYVVGLRDRGHQSHVFTLCRTNIDERPYDDVYEMTLPPRWHPDRIYPGIERRLGFIDLEEQSFRVARKQALDWLRELQPDIVHAHFGPIGVLVEPVAQRLDIPLVVSFLGYDGSKLLRSSHWRRLYLKMSLGASTIIGISHYMCNRLTGIGIDQKKIRRISLGIEIDQFEYQNPATTFDGRNIHCLHVGRLTEKKSPLHLVEAFDLARKALLPDIELRLTIAGDGELREALAQKIEDLNLSDDVHTLGAVNHSEVKQLFQKAHIYTQYCETTREGDTEGQGVTFVEASSSGLPIVTTRHNGIPDVVLDGITGYLVEEGDIQGMADRIAKLARQPEQWKALGQAGRQHVEKNFSLEMQLEKSEHLYMQIVRSQRKNG